LKYVVIRGGENVSPREVEEFLYTHPSIKDVAVVGVPDQKYGEEMCAWVVLKDGTPAPSADEIRNYCRGKIAHYKIPRYIKFAEDLPMTVNGKVQKFRMREASIRELGLEGAAAIVTA
jgi:fatty-acyl-CoA synthase